MESISESTRKLLKVVCLRKIQDRQLWERVYGSLSPCPILEPKHEGVEEYRLFSNKSEIIYYKCAQKLLNNGDWPIYTHLIMGDCPPSIHTYDIEDKLIEIYGEKKILPDSERSWFYILTAPDVAEDVFFTAQQLLGIDGDDNSVDNSELSLTVELEQVTIYRVGDFTTTLALLKELYK